MEKKYHLPSEKKISHFFCQFFGTRKLLAYFLKKKLSCTYAQVYDKILPILLSWAHRYSRLNTKFFEDVPKIAEKIEKNSPKLIRKKNRNVPARKQDNQFL